LAGNRWRARTFTDVLNGRHGVGNYLLDQASKGVPGSLACTLDTLLPAEICGDEDHQIGKVNRVRGISTDSEVIIDVGGLLGMGAKSVMMAEKYLIFMRGDYG
jgi:hypothetical protein